MNVMHVIKTIMNVLNAKDVSSHVVQDGLIIITFWMIKPTIQCVDLKNNDLMYYILKWIDAINL